MGLESGGRGVFSVKPTYKKFESLMVLEGGKSGEERRVFDCIW